MSASKKITTIHPALPHTHSFSIAQCPTCLSQWAAAPRGRLNKCPECHGAMQRLTITTTVKVEPHE